MPKQTRTVCDQTCWANDPLSHPDIQKMSQRELADLPVSTYYRAVQKSEVKPDLCS